MPKRGVIGDDNIVGQRVVALRKEQKLKQKDLLKNLMQSPDTQRLMQLLHQSAGDGLKGAAASAAKGDPSALTGLLRQVMQSKEGAQLVQRINQAVPEDKR